MKHFSCVFEPENDEMRSGTSPLQGSWHSYFNNTHPITLELGCGKGEYTLALARKYPGQNFIGVDVKGARIWRGAKTAEVEGLQNVAFLRTRIEFISTFFAPGEVSALWLTFSDPHPTDNKGNRRLTSPLFLERYRQIMALPAAVHLKTDSTLLYDFTLDVLAQSPHELRYSLADIHLDTNSIPDALRELLQVKTHYERLFIARGKRIKYLQFQLHGEHS